MTDRAKQDLAALNALIARQGCAVCEMQVGHDHTVLRDGRGRPTAVVCPICAEIVRNIEAGTLENSHLERVPAWKLANERKAA